MLACPPGIACPLSASSYRPACCAHTTPAAAGHGVMRDVEHLMAWLLWLRRSGGGLWRSYVDLLPQVGVGSLMCGSWGTACCRCRPAKCCTVVPGRQHWRCQSADAHGSSLATTSPLPRRATPLPRCPSSSRTLSWSSCRCRAWRRRPGTTAASLLPSTSGEAVE